MADGIAPLLGGGVVGKSELGREHRCSSASVGKGELGTRPGQNAQLICWRSGLHTSCCDRNAVGRETPRWGREEISSNKSSPLIPSRYTPPNHREDAIHENRPADSELH